MLAFSIYLGVAALCFIVCVVIIQLTVEDRIVETMTMQGYWIREPMKNKYIAFACFMSIGWPAFLSLAIVSSPLVLAYWVGLLVAYMLKKG